MHKDTEDTRIENIDRPTGDADTEDAGTEDAAPIAMMSALTASSTLPAVNCDIMSWKLDYWWTVAVLPMISLILSK